MQSVLTAAAFACKAAAISVTRMGAQASAPYKNEVRTVKLNEVVCRNKMVDRNLIISIKTT
jgi:hypothetical protein